jgi:hypothetical protein
MQHARSEFVKSDHAIDFETTHQRQLSAFFAFTARLTVAQCTPNASAISLRL